MTPTMKTIRLYGHLRKQFGREFRLAVATPGEAIRALSSQLKGFRNHLMTNSAPGYHILVGKESYDETELEFPAGQSEVIKIVPAMGGAGSGFKVILGAVLVAASYVWQPMAWARPIGMSLMMSGVAEMLAPGPPIGLLSDGKPTDMPSYAFGGPTSTVGQGYPVPLLYGGPLRVGGCIVSAGIMSETFQSKGFGGTATDDLGTIAGDGDTTPWSWSIGPV